MVEMQALAATLAGGKTALDIAKTMFSLRDAELVRQKALELQGVILSTQESALAAQVAQSSLVEEVRQLKAQIAELEAWDREGARYELTDYGGGTFAYALKADESRGEPLHRLCARCYQQRHKSILQFRTKPADQRDRYVCPECKTEFAFGERQLPARQERSTPRPNSWLAR